MKTNNTNNCIANQVNDEQIQEVLAQVCRNLKIPLKVVDPDGLKVPMEKQIRNWFNPFYASLDVHKNAIFDTEACNDRYKGNSCILALICYLGLIEGWSNLQSARAVLWRLKETISLIVSLNNPHVTDVASGACFVRLVCALLNIPIESYLGIDSDMEAIKRANSLFEGIGVRANAIKYNYERPGTEGVWLITILGLTDYLDDKLVIFLLKKVMEQMKKGDIILWGNFMPPGDDEQLKKEKHLLDTSNWYLIRRTREEMIALVQKVAATYHKKINISFTFKGPQGLLKITIS